MTKIHETIAHIDEANARGISRPSDDIAHDLHELTEAVREAIDALSELSPGTWAAVSGLLEENDAECLAFALDSLGIDTTVQA